MVFDSALSGQRVAMIHRGGKNPNMFPHLYRIVHEEKIVVVVVVVRSVLRLTRSTIGLLWCRDYSINVD